MWDIRRISLKFAMFISLVLTGCGDATETDGQSEDDVTVEVAPETSHASDKDANEGADETIDSSGDVNDLTADESDDEAEVDYWDRDRSTTSGATDGSVDLAAANAVVDSFAPEEEFRSTSATNGTLTLAFPADEPHAGFFQTNLVDRMLAVDAMRLFAELPDLKQLEVTIRGERATIVTREEAERFHGITFADYAGDDLFWNEAFPASVSSESSSSFAEKFAR